MRHTVLVTGGAGYLGSITCVRLVECGYRPLLLDDFSNSHPTVVARIVEGGEVRQVDFQYAVGDADVALDSYRYATRRWERSGAVRDPFGHEWLIGHEIEALTPAEMQRRYDALFTPA